MKNRSKFLVNLFKFIRFPNINLIWRGTMIILMFFVTQVIGINTYAAELQQVAITGTVTDNEGLPLAGVSVIVKGTTSGAITDMAGKYSLTNVPQNATLLFSFVGMAPQEIPLNGRIRIDAVMIEEAIGLNEVVVIGYGTVKKVNLTGSVASISGDEMIKRPVTSATAMLQGLMAGVQVTQGTGEPGNEALNIRIRGTGTFSSAGSDPMVLIDGVLGNLANVRPSDIESISVLKDAASASIYGARAANGVILVTTKSGTEGKMTIEYDMNYAIHNYTKMFDVVYNSAEYMELFNEARINSGLSSGLYPQATIDLYRSATDRNKYPNYDWVANSFAPAPTQTHDLSFSGGNSGTKYNFSLGYVDQVGVMKGFNYKRYNARLNLTSQINKKIKFGANISLKNGVREGPRQGSEDTFIAIMAQPPTYSPQLSDGSGRWTFKAYDFEYNNKNPGAIVGNKVFRNTVDYSITTLGWFEVEILKSLTWYTKGALNTDFSKYDDFRPQVPLYNFQTGAYMTLLDVGGAGLQMRDDQNIYSNLYSYLNFNHSFNGVHNVNLQAGYSMENNTSDYLQGYRQYFASDNYRQLDAGSPAVQSANGSKYENSLMSFFGRMSYNYRERYLVEANMRYDGTSRLNPDSRWGAFPSFSAAWRVTEEDFIKNLGLGWMNNLKIRASYGTLGNQNIGNYPYQAILSLTGNYPFDDASLNSGVAQTRLANPVIKWETTTITDVGLDLTVLGGLTMNLDWYKKRTSDILRGSQVTGIVGLSAPTVNNGTMENTGIELTLVYAGNVKTGFLSGLNYNAGVSLDHFKNKLVHFGAREISGYRIREEGGEWDSFFMLEQIGIFQTAEEITNSPKQYTDATVPGDLKWKDQITVDTDGDGVADATDGKINDGDRIAMKGQYPSLNYSFNGAANWKGFDFYFLAQGVEGIKFFVQDWGYIPFVQGAPPTTNWRDRWTTENPSTTMPRIYWGWSSPTRLTRNNSWFLQDASYMRLKNIAFGYTLPANLTERVGIGSLRIYFSGDNLLTFTKYPGLDPERGSSGRFVRYPQNKIFAFGLNVKF